MKNRLLAALLALLLLAAMPGLAEDMPEAIERAVQEEPTFVMEDADPPEEPPVIEAEETAEAEPEAEDPEPEAPEPEAVPAKEPPAEEPGEEMPGEMEEPGEGEKPSAVEEPEQPAGELSAEAPVPLPTAEKIPALTPVSPERPENPEGVDPRNCQHPVTVAVVNRDARDISYHDLHNGTHRITGSGVLVVICADCGMAVDRKDEYIEKCSYNAPDESGAVCRYCDHVKGDDGRHIHEFTGEYHDFCGALLGAVPDPAAPELYHVCRFQKLRARKCALCDTYEDSEPLPGETIETRETHVWQADGRCALCGYVRTCRHQGEVIENIWNEDERYTFVNAAVHEYSAVHYVQRCCADCGEPLGNVEVSRVNVRQPHRYEDGVCADCGYVNVCDHPHMVYAYAVEPGGAAYAPVDGLNHKVGNLGGIYITDERCPDCGFALTGVHLAIPASQSITLPHRFDRNGVCLDCGYDAQVTQDECPHPEAYRVALDPADAGALKQACRYTVDADAGTAAEHVLRVEYDPSWTCALCGYHEDLRGETRTITISEAHNFYKGYCVTANCGYRCAHPRVSGEAAEGAPFYDYDDASGHYATIPTVVTGTCELCGEYVKNHVVEKVRGQLEAHTMSNGVCTRCGYVCPHPDGELVRLLPAEHTVYSRFDENEHEVREERVTETICQACGYTLFEEVETLGEYRMPHYLVDGVCEQCGYDPLNDLPEPETEEYDDLPDDERLYGVCAEDGTDIVTACLRVGDSLQAGLDRGEIKVRLEGISRLFNSAERKRLAALPLREQFLSAQYFLGFEDAVARAVAMNEDLLSRDALKIIRHARNRIDGMSEADRAAYEQARRTAFPMTSFEIVPGVTTEVFNLDIAVRENGATTVNRFSFQNTGSSWNLINIAVR